MTHPTSRTDLSFVSALVDGSAATVSSVAELRAHVASLDATSMGDAATADTIEQAALGGRAAEGLGWAFACGYLAALRRLRAGTGQADQARQGNLVALCASEEGGAHPRLIKTTLTPRPDGGWTLSGTKTWVTLGTEADVLLVVASTGLDEGGRNRLRVAAVPRERMGVSLQPAPPLPFAPEISHARLVLHDVAVAVDELLAGDGYDDVLKPFRTLEDAHVVAAALGWAIGVARPNAASGENAWDREWVARAVALVVALRAIGAAPPSSAETHLALAGVMASARALLDAAPWSLAPSKTVERWNRDRALLEVASGVRAARFEAAWRKLTDVP